jgi:4-aminobutyrate aminotransferase-like enzyme
LSSGSSRIAGDRPVPHIVTELPGPKARAHVEFDETWTSPSLPRAYPIVPIRGDGLVVEDIDGNLFLDFAAGIAVNSTGHSHPQVVAAIKEQASELIHFSASDFYLPIYPEVCRELARIAPISGRARAYLGNSGTEVVEASIKLARFATKRPYIVAFLGAFHGRTYGSVSLTASKAKYHAGFGPAPAGDLPRPVREGRGPQVVRRRPVRQARAGRRGRGDHRRADPGRGRLHRPRGRFPPGPPRHLRQARHPAHRRRDPVGRRAGPARCGRSTTGASSRTSC